MSSFRIELFMIKNIYMKSIIKSIILFSVFAISFMSCETYSDPKVDYSPIYPLSGEWRVRITNLSTNTVLGTTAAPATPTMFTLGTYNSSSNSVDSLWIRITSTIPFSGLASSTKNTTFKSKITCDVKNLTFSTIGTVKNINVTTNAVIDTISITEAQVSLNSVEMPSGVTADRIKFKLAKTRSSGVTYLVEGYRRTRWNEDESFITFK
jgi:hypothetical protein